MQLAPQSYEMNIHISGMQNRVTPENSSTGITVLLISNVVQLLSFILLSLHTQYAEQGKVYVTVGCPSICLSVPLIDSSSSSGWRVCCWAPCRKEILINSCGCTVGVALEACWHSAANEGSIMPTCWFNYLRWWPKQYTVTIYRRPTMLQK